MTEELPTEQPKSKGSDRKSRRSRRWSFVVSGVILVLIGFFLWRFLARPAVGTIHSGTAPAVSGLFEDEKERKRFSGKYLDFSYPAAYSEKHHDTPVNGPVKENLFFSAVDFEGRKIAVTVEDRGKGYWEGSPSFQMRLNKPKEYEQYDFFQAGFQGFRFAKKTPVFEQDAFFFSEGFFVSVAVTSPIKMEGLEEELEQVVQSMTIRN